MEKATLGFHIYKTWQILKHFASINLLFLKLPTQLNYNTQLKLGPYPSRDPLSIIIKNLGLLICATKFQPISAIISRQENCMYTSQYYIVVHNILLPEKSTFSALGTIVSL